MVNVNYLTDEPGLFGIFTPENFALLESEGRGPLTSNYPEAGGFFRTRPIFPRTTWSSTSPRRRSSTRA